jgi:uncharacterized protein YegL
MAVGGKIQTLNHVIREAIPHLQQAAKEAPNAEVVVRALKFSSGAQWHISPPVPVADFQWIDLTAKGAAEMGKALTLLADELKIPPMIDRALPPVLVLLSDGRPTDDFAGGLKALMDQPWGRKAARIAMAIGEDADHDVLQRFIGHAELRPLQANNPEALAKHIKWCSSHPAMMTSASSPPGQSKDRAAGGDSVAFPAAPDGGPSGPDDVW